MQIPVSVLIAICKAIDADERARDKAAECSISISPFFVGALAVPIKQIRDPEIRQWAWNEIRDAGTR